MPSNVPIVNNGSIPVLGEFNMDLREEVLIDSSKSLPLLNMYYIGDFGIDSSGSLFLLANDFVVKYSNNGELLKHYPIKIGQGPGEFNIGACPKVT